MMNDNRMKRQIQHSINTRLSGLQSDPWLAQRLLAEKEKIMVMKRSYTIRRTVLIAAVLIAMTTAIGFATGLFQSAFSRMKTDGFAGNPTMDYDKLEALADTDVSLQRVTFSNDVNAEFSLEQSYYNGEQLVLGWTYKGPDTVEFFEKGDERFSEVHPTEREIIVDGHAYIENDNINIEERFAPEIISEIHDRVFENHWAGIFWYDVWMSDGVWLPDAPSHESSWDGTPIEEENTRLYPATERNWNKIGAGQRYYECETPLPEAARKQESLKIMCKVYIRPTWMCFDGESGNIKSYIGYGETEAQEIYFDIPLTGEYEEKTYQAEAAFPNHTALVTINTTPIYAQIEVTSRISEVWKQAWAEYEGYYMPPLNLQEDCAFNYEVWIERDGQTERVLDLLEDIDGIEEFSGQFVIPDGTSAVILRPIYANTGIHQSEELKVLLD